jgi:lipopolysaccharide assembly protein A
MKINTAATICFPAGFDKGAKRDHRQPRSHDFASKATQRAAIACYRGRAESFPRRVRALQRRQVMRWFHLTLIAVLAAATLIFALQNLQSVTVAFLNFRLSAPLAVLVAVVYVLGMLTGGSLWALFRWALEGSKAKRPATS